METKKRLIDANLIVVPKYDMRGRDLFNQGYCQGKIDGILEVKALAPTVDAAEIVHSQWDTVFYESHGTLATYSHLCPVCKYFYRDTRFKGHNYCPSCGAKMDGDGIER